MAYGACAAAARLGMLPAESAAPLKLLERGVSKEALAGMVSLVSGLDTTRSKRYLWVLWQSVLMLLLLLLLRLGMLPAGSAAPSKLLEWGVSKEALAG